MLNQDFLSSFVIGTLSLVIATFVFFATKRSVPNRYFVFFAVFQALWIISNYFSNNFTISPSLALLANHFTLFFSGLCLLSLNMFAIEYCQDQKFLKYKKYIILPSIIINIISLTPLVIKSIERQEEVYALNFGPLYLFYFLILLGNALVAFFIFIRNYRIQVGQEKEKIKFILISLISGIGFISITNIFIPVVLGSFALTDIGQFGSLIIVAGIGYTIARHRLFDISTLVVRSFVYTLTTAVLVSTYSAVSLAVKSYLVSANISQNISTFAEIVLLAIFGISFYPLRLYFDRLTTKFFFRNHYSTNQLIKIINNILVQSVDLAKMLHKVSSILKSSMLVEYCAFLLIETDRTRDLGVGRYPADMEGIVKLHKCFDKKRNVLVIDKLKKAKIDKDLEEYLVSNGISAVVRLQKLSQDKRVESEGYLLIGKKQSGKPINTQDEQLLETISGHLATAIQNLVHLDEIIDFNQKLQNEVADATKELKVKNTKLKQLDRNKDEFVSMASHQLRTPLTSIKGYLSMVLDGDAGELKPAQRQLLEQAYTSTQRMVFLIADLLNLSRLNTGKFVINAEPTSLAAIIEGEIKQIQKTAEQKGVTVSFYCDPSIPNIHLDQMKTRQVIMNFIDNAIYYTAQGGMIDISLRRSGKVATFSVVDNGMGVPKAEQKELFTKFYRGSNARKSRPDGTGLGLYMAKKVIDSQNGTLLFQSREGEGSMFGFSFDIPKD